MKRARRSHIPYSARELEFIEKRRTLTRRQLRVEFVRKFGRDDVLVGDLHRLCKSKGWSTGRHGRYSKGAVPANKGKKMPYNANSARTRFKKGQSPPNIKFAGHERVDKNGYILISVNETNPHTGFERRYVLKHKHLWERSNGPVPEGHALKCKGDRLNCDPSNWELVPRAMLPRLNNRWGRNYDEAPDDLKPTIMALAKLEHRLSEKARGRERDR